jgi:ABC-2 type transport system permease protein
MLKLVKYELRGNLFIIIGICISLIIGNFMLLTRKGIWNTSTLHAVSALIAFAGMVVIFIYSVNIMSKYLHNDSGYLLFTLPQSGISIVTSRLITGIIQITGIGIVAAIATYLCFDGKINFSFLHYINFKMVIYSLVSYLYYMAYLLILIYFSMIIGKAALRSRKLGKIGSFLVFIILIVGITWITVKIDRIFPQTFDLGKILNANTSGIYGSIDFSYKMNIANTIFGLLLFGGLFSSSSYLLEKKVDL